MIIDFRNIIGECFVTNEGYSIQIIDYVDTKNVLIKFVDRPEIQILSTLQNIKNGQVKIHYINLCIILDIMALVITQQEKMELKQKNM